MSSFPRSVWRIVQAAREENLTGEAARIAYHFFLSVWPLFLGLFALTGILGGQAAFDLIISRFQEFLPGDATRFLERYVHEITGKQRPDMLSLGIILTLWSGSNIFAALIEGLNEMYDIEEGRPWWKRRLLSVVLLLFGSVLLTGGAAAILAGSEILAALGLRAAYFGILRWPLAFVLVVALLWLIYYFLPNRDQAMSKLYVLVGALVGGALWVLTTAGFRLYVANFGSYDRTYGFVGAVIVLLIWMFLTALTVLIGGEVAMSLEQGVHQEERTSPNPNAKEAHG